MGHAKISCIWVAIEKLELEHIYLFNSLIVQTDCILIDITLSYAFNNRSSEQEGEKSWLALEKYKTWALQM